MRQPSLKPMPGSLRVLLFFAANPDECLTTADVAAKAGVEQCSVRALMQHRVETGLLARTSTRTGPGAMTTYTAGPELLRAIGLAP